VRASLEPHLIRAELAPGVFWLVPDCDLDAVSRMLSQSTRARVRVCGSPRRVAASAAPERDSWGGDARYFQVPAEPSLPLRSCADPGLRERVRVAAAPGTSSCAPACRVDPGNLARHREELIARIDAWKQCLPASKLHSAALLEQALTEDPAAQLAILTLAPAEVAGILERSRKVRECLDLLIGAALFEFDPEAYARIGQTSPAAAEVGANRPAWPAEMSSQPRRK
jgi:hypothetical protein